MRIARRIEQIAAEGPQYVRYTAGIRSDYRLAAKHRFDDDATKRFRFDRRVYDDIDSTHKVRNVIAMPEKTDA
jgi:hypothetical protein